MKTIKFFGLALSMLVGLMTTSYAQDNKVLVVLTSHIEMGDTGKKTGFWLGELTHPYYVLADAGVAIDVVSIDGGMAPIDPSSVDLNDKVNQRFFKDAELMSQVINSRKLSDVNSADYQAIIFTGGHGTMWDFPNSDSVNKVSAAIYENNGIVAAVCHGPAALMNIKLSNGTYLIDNKKFAGFTNEEEAMIKLTKVVPFSLEDELISRGGKHVYAKAWTENAIADQRLITGQNPQSAHKVGQLILAELKKL